MKFCINCQNYIPPADALSVARCSALISTPLRLNLVDGTTIAPTFRSCDAARCTNIWCGEHAKFFQHKTTHAEIKSALKELYD